MSELPAYEVSCVTGAVMLVRKSTFNQQPFDESYIRCGEDVQLNLDLREAEGRVMLCPGMSGFTSKVPPEKSWRDWQHF